MKLICWDYNGTVAGNYEKGTPTAIIRPNLHDTLADLKQQGYSSVITTTISSKGVEQSIKSMGLDDVVEKKLELAKQESLLNKPDEDMSDDKDKPDNKDVAKNKDKKNDGEKTNDNK